MSYIHTSIEGVLGKLQGAYAPNTLKSYYADARAFVDWCGERNVDPFPIASETLCNYIEYLQQNAAYSTIRRRVSSLSRLNKMLGFEDQTRT
jgi:site-specific recombinase XerD